MSKNIVNDISSIYYEQIFESAVPGKPAERLGAVTAISKEEQEAARERTLAKAKAMRERKNIKNEEYVDEALRSREERMARMVTPAKKKEQERTRKGRAILADIQATEKALKEPKNSTPQQPTYDTPAAEVRKLKPGQKKDTLALKVKKAMSEAKKVKKWWDDDGDNIGYEEGEVSGKFKKKKKEVKEGFSNWRQDLSEIMDVISKNEDKKKIPVKNIIIINPNIAEVVEELGGSLLEMVEVENVDCILDDLLESEVFLLSDKLIEEVVEEFFFECIREGYDTEEVENVLIESIDVSAALLTEAKVTLGHDTDIKTDRLGKVKSAVKKVARGVGYVAGAAVRGARAVGREVSKGYERGSGGSSGGDSSSVSQSSSSQSDTKETGSKRPGLLGRIGSALKSGLKKAVGAGARAVSRGARNVARRMEDGEKKTTTNVPVNKPKAKVSTSEAPKTAPKKVEKPADPWEGSATTPAKAKVAPKAKQKATTPAKPKATTPAKPKATVKTKTTGVKKTSKLDDLLSSIRSEAKETTAIGMRLIDPYEKAPYSDDKEEVKLNEKTLTPAELKKREEIAQKMNLKDFEKRYPGRGMEVKMATATKIAKKLAEQALEMQSKTQQEPDQDQQKKNSQQKDRMRQQEIQIMQRKLQAMRSAPKGTDPSITAGYEPEGELVDEARAEEKRGFGSTGTQRRIQKTAVVTPSGQVTNPVTSYSGGQNPHFRGKDYLNKTERRAASRNYVDQPGGVYAKPENQQGKNRYLDMQTTKRDQSNISTKGT